MEDYCRMIKINTDNSIILIGRQDIEEGITALRKRSGIKVLTNGIYRLYNKDGILLYIGRGKNVLNRVVTHMKGKNSNTRHFFKEMELAEIHILPLYSEGATEDLEQYLIKVLNPKYNRLKWLDETIISRIQDFEI